MLPNHSGGSGVHVGLTGDKPSRYERHVLVLGSGRTMTMGKRIHTIALRALWFRHQLFRISNSSRSSGQLV